MQRLLAKARLNDFLRNAFDRFPIQQSEDCILARKYALLKPFNAELLPVPDQAQPIIMLLTTDVHNRLNGRLPVWICVKLSAQCFQLNEMI